MTDKQATPPLRLADEKTRSTTSVNRRRFLRSIGTIGTGALLAACGVPETASPTIPPPTATGVTPTNEPTVAASSTTPAVAAPAATVASADYPRTIKDTAEIDVTIPARPQRVLCLSNLTDLDALLSLGIAPMQFGIRSFIKQYTGSEQVSWKWHEETLAKLNAKAIRMNGDQTNIEVVAAAKPDLILGTSSYTEEGREQLATIAPVIELVFNWRENLNILGKVFAMEQQATQLIEDTDTRIATSLKDYAIGTRTAAIISCYDNTVYYGFGNAADGRADLFERAGFTLLEAIRSKATAAEPRPEFSIEALPLLEPADVIVLFDYGDGTVGSGILENPIFNALPAVKDGRLVVLKQGELAQGLSTISPINIDYCLNVVRQTAQLLV